MTQTAGEILRKYAGVYFHDLTGWSTEDLLDMQERIEEEIRWRAENASDEEHN